MTTITPTEVTTEDYHTGGEPFRIVTGGVPELQGATVAERRLWAAEHLEDIRRFLVNEPRGHADMYGGFVTPPDDPDGDLGVVFFHNEGWSTACGHGTIALATWAVERGVVGRADEGEIRMVVDVPSGRLPVTVVVDDDGAVGSVAFRNVPSFVAADLLVGIGTADDVPLTVAFGGAFYGIVRAGDLGLAVTPGDLPRTIETCRALKAALNTQREWVHPVDDRLRDVYGIIVVEDVDVDGLPTPIPPLDDDVPDVVQRNVTVFADGEVDRSPTGSGTSARLAALHAAGRIATGQRLVNLSVVGSVMTGMVVGDTAVGRHAAVETLVSGSAYATGRHTFVLDPRDTLGTGFLLR